MKNDVKLHCVIINGHPTEQSIKDYTDKGWVFVNYYSADRFHPYAMPTDIIMFFAKPIDKEAYDAEMKDFYESQCHICDVAE